MSTVATIVFIDADGIAHTVSANFGFTVMESAVWNAVPGIEAQCGGSCACATCQVCVDPKWTSIVGPPTGTELALLEGLEARAPNSRLSCQIKVSAALDGLILRIPAAHTAS
jgi:2Fe-2S ferredoxin